MADLATILLTATMTTAGTALVSYIGHKLASSRDERENERRASYAAIRVVCALDDFVWACAEAASDRGEYDPHGERYPTISDPTLTFADDIDWKALEASLMYKALALPNKLAGCNRAVQDVGTYMAGPPDYEEVFEQRGLEFGQIGIEADQLADSFRVKYGIEPRPGSSFFRQRMESARMDALRARSDREERSRALMAKLDAELCTPDQRQASDPPKR